MHGNTGTFGAVKANPPKPGDGGSRGGNSVQANFSAMPTTNVAATHTVSAATRLLSTVLERTASWLLAYAYGAFSETVTRRGRALADVTALTVYASAITPVPVSFDATGEDLSARRLLDAAAFLIPGCRVRICATPRPAAHIDAATALADRRTANVAELPLLPALATADRGTAATLRRDIIADAGERRERIISNGGEPAQVVRSVARIADGRWPDVAAMLLEPDRLPASAHADGKAVADGQ